MTQKSYGGCIAIQQLNHVKMVITLFQWDLHAGRCFLHPPTLESIEYAWYSYYLRLFFPYTQQARCVCMEPGRPHMTTHSPSNLLDCTDPKMLSDKSHARALRSLRPLACIFKKGNISCSQRLVHAITGLRGLQKKQSLIVEFTLTLHRWISKLLATRHLQMFHEETI